MMCPNMKLLEEKPTINMYKVKCKDYDAVTHHAVIRGPKTNYEMKWKDYDVSNYATKEYAQKKRGLNIIQVTKNTNKETCFGSCYISYKK